MASSLLLRRFAPVAVMVVALACDDGGSAPPPGPPFEAAALALGVNPPGAEAPHGFTEIPDGGVLPIVRGEQGLWMISLALRAPNPTHGTFALEVDLRDGDQPLATLQRSRQRFVVADDGYAYYYDAWLVFEGLFTTGAPVTLTVRCADSDGHVVAVTRSARLDAAKPAERGD